MKTQLALRMKYRLRRYESGTACRMRVFNYPHEASGDDFFSG